MLLCVAILAAIVGLVAQTPEWQLAVSAGGTNDDYCYDIATDSQGNQYVTGKFQETATFGSFTLTSCGSYDIFVAKLDLAGNFLWAATAGGLNSEAALSIAVDGAGNTWLTGTFQATATFGTHQLTSAGILDIFAAKLDPAGNFLWAVRAGGENYDHGYSIAVSDDGNAYLTGDFSLSATFGPYTLTSNGLIDIFAVKLDPEGNFLWAVQAGGPSYDFGKGIAVDSAGNASLTGHFYESANFGSHTISSAANNDIFIAKLDSTGNWLWAVSAGGTSIDEGTDIAFDNAGNTWVTGYYGANTSFGETSLPNSGSFDIFICKLDSAGNLLWVTHAGGTDADYCQGIAVDSAGNAWLTGMFRETITIGSNTFISRGGFDIFAAKLDPAGDFLWAVNAGGVSADHSYGIVPDGAGNAWVTGHFKEIASFGSHALISAGLEDIFVTKLTSGTPVEDELHPPVVFPILSASPNPFAASTVIRFAGGKPQAGSANAALVIYNLRGQKVRSLSPATACMNGSELNWDGRDEGGSPCPNGIYLALLDLNGRRATLKLTLVR